MQWTFPQLVKNDKDRSNTDEIFTTSYFGEKAINKIRCHLLSQWLKKNMQVTKVEGNSYKLK